MNFRPLWWVLLVLGGVVAVLAVVYAIQSNKRKEITQEDAVDPSKPPVSEPTVPSAPTVPGTTTVPTSTPPYVPSTGGNQVPNDKWVEATTWKANELFKGYRKYACEVTNALVEMSDIQITALVKLYYDWYGGSLPSLYCEKVKSSGCFTDWSETRHKDACKRLNKLKI